MLSVLGLVMRNQGVFGANLLKLLADEEGRAVVTRAFDAALRGFEDGSLRAVVDRTFPLAEAGAAQELPPVPGQRGQGGAGHAAVAGRTR